MKSKGKKRVNVKWTYAPSIFNNKNKTVLKLIFPPQIAETKPIIFRYLKIHALSGLFL